MRPILADRLFVIWIAAALTLWCGMLVILWGESFDPSGTSALATLAALMLAIGAASGMPARAAGALQRLLTALRLQDSLAMELARAESVPAGRRGVRAMMRLLAAGAVFAAIGGLVSTAMVYLVSTPAEPHAQGPFLWGPSAWAAIKLLIQFLAMLPMALGISVTFLVTALIRGGSGRDVYASVFREWLVGVAAGLAAAAATWRIAADILGVALVACVALGAAAAVLLLRAKLAIRPRRSMRPVESAPRRGGQVAIATGAGALSLALLVQMRLLRDVARVGLSGRVFWAGASLGLLVWFLRRADRRSRPPGATQALAATIGLLGGLLLQLSLAVRCLVGGAAAVGCGVMAAGAQVPLAALGAIIVSRQRRLFAVGGGRARKYLGSVCAGVGAGLLAYLAAGATSLAPATGLAVCLVGMVAVVVKGASTARRPARRLRWTVPGVVLVCAAGAAPLAAVHGLPPMRAGVWLTTASAVRGRGHEVLPLDGGIGPARRRSEAVTAAVAAVLEAHPGRWWMVLAAAADVPAALPATVSPWRSHPDPTASPGVDLLGRGQRAWGDFLYEVAKDPRRFDGAILAPMPADHPDAWQCYAPAVLRRCRRKLHEPAVMVLRTQAGPRAIDDGLAVARAFEDVLEGGWAVVALIEGHLDVLLIGAAGAVPRPEARPGVFVVPLGRLCPEGTPRGWLGGRGPLLRGTTGPQELRRHLERVRLSAE